MALSGTFRLPPSDEIRELLSDEGDDPYSEVLVTVIAAYGGLQTDVNSFARDMAEVIARLCQERSVEDAGSIRARFVGYVQLLIPDETLRHEVIKRL